MILIAGDSAYTLDAGLLSLQQQARSSMVRMTRELRNATSDNIPAGGAANVTFTTPTSAGIQYFRDANNLIRQSPPGTADTQQIMSNFASGLNFSKDLPTGLITIDLTTTNAVAGRVFSFPATGTFRGQVRPRNEP